MRIPLQQRAETLRIEVRFDTGPLAGELTAATPLEVVDSED